MNKDIVNEKIINIIRVKQILPDDIDIDVNNNLVDTYGINSIGFIEIMVSLEEEFGFEFDDIELDIFNFENINTISGIVLKHINK